MKKFAFSVAAFYLSFAALYGLPLHNPLDPCWLEDGVIWEGNCVSICEPGAKWCDAWSFRTGYEGNFVFDRRMEIDMHEQDSDIRQFKFYTNAAYLCVNFWNWVDVFATLGQTKFTITTPGSAYFVSGIPLNHRTTLGTETSFSWSTGVRAKLWECRSFGLGAEVEYFHARPDMNYFENDGENVAYLHNSRANYMEYQVGLGATYQIPLGACGTFVVPYVAGKWANAQFKPDDYQVVSENTLYEIHKMCARHHGGAVLGLTLVGSKMWDFTAEARFGDELALHLNSQVRF